MSRQRLDFSYEFEISLLMINKGWENSPQKIHEYFVHKSKVDPGGYVNYPAPRTIAKYMRLIRLGDVALKEQRRDFEYPLHMGSGQDQVPWELARFALDCLGFYAMKHGIRPSVGLARRFALVSVASQGPSPLSDEQRAMIAERLWLADLIGDTESGNRPSTSYEEFRLAIKGWTLPGNDLLPDLAEKMGAKQWQMPSAYFRFIRHMPEHKTTLEQYLNSRTIQKD